MARYMGPPLALTYTVQTFSHLWHSGLLQNFYKVSQETNEKVPSFAVRLEGTLNEIQLQCPGRMTDLEAQQHLRDHLFHAVENYICDSLQYSLQHPWNIVFLGHDSCLKGRE